MKSPSGRKSPYIWLTVLLLPLAGIACIVGYSHMYPRMWGLLASFNTLWVLLSAALAVVICVKSEPRRVAVHTGRSTRPRA